MSRGIKAAYIIKFANYFTLKSGDDSRLSKCTQYNYKGI